MLFVQEAAQTLSGAQRIASRKGRRARRARMEREKEGKGGESAGKVGLVVLTHRGQQLFSPRKQHSESPVRGRV
eukprot:763193-Hanusia_phi.AAC.1